MKLVSKDRQRRGDLGFLDRGVVDASQRAGTERTGGAGAGTGVQRRRLEPADRNALGTEGR